MIKIKICGLTRSLDIDIVNEAMPDYIGFVFAESRRRVTHTQAAAMKKRLSGSIKAVGVFVNAETDEIAGLCNRGVIDLVQLHGDEDLDYFLSLKKKIKCLIIKAVRVQNPQQITRVQALPCDYLLLDTYQKEQYGGTGAAFDYALIPKMHKPFFLAGGLNADNIKKAANVSPYCLDISSGVETDGVKDAEKIKEIIKIIREEY